MDSQCGFGCLEQRLKITGHRAPGQLRDFRAHYWNVSRVLLGELASQFGNPVLGVLWCQRYGGPQVSLRRHKVWDLPDTRAKGEITG